MPCNCEIFCLILDIRNLLNFIGTLRDLIGARSCHFLIDHLPECSLRLETLIGKCRGNQKQVLFFPGFVIQMNPCM